MSLFSTVRSHPDVEVVPARHNINFPFLNVPEDLLDIFSNCGGIVIFPGSPFSIDIFGPERFLPANPTLYPDPLDPIWDELTGDISAYWFLVGGEPRQSQYLSMDLHPARKGAIYDSFLETYASPGDSSILARSLTEFVETALDKGPGNWFWTRADYVSLGDAYGERDG